MDEIEEILYRRAEIHNATFGFFLKNISPKNSKSCCDKHDAYWLIQIFSGNLTDSLSYLKRHNLG